MIRLGFILVALIAGPAAAEETLARWAENFDTPEVQQLILNKIFSGQVGPLNAAVLDKGSNRYLFPKNDSWVELGRDKVFFPASKTEKPTLVVSCMLYNRPERGPVTATSYLFQDPSQRPVAISGGYAAQERVDLVQLPKLGKTFLVLVDTSKNGSVPQCSAFVLSLDRSGHPRSVWNSPMSARSFQFGFDTLGSRTEALVFRSYKRQDTQY